MRIKLGRFVPRTRRAQFCCGGVVVIVAVAGFLIVPVVIERIVRSQLETLVADQLNAELQIGKFVYNAPYGITVIDARLVAKSPDDKPVSLLEVRQLDLTLAKSPLGSGPLVIKELLIREPSVHLIQTAEGMIGQRTLVKTGGPEPPQRKLSEIFELRRIAIDRGQVVYEDRTKPASVPLVWRGLQLDLTTQPQAPAVYSYDFKAGAAAAASLDARGDFNIDELVLNVANCSLESILRPDAPESPLPGELQERLRDYAIDGKLSLNVSGAAPLRDMKHAAFAGTLELAGARGKVPKYNVDVRRLALAVAFRQQSGAGVDVMLKQFEAESPDGVVRVGKGKLSVNGDAFDAEGIAGAVTFASESQLGLSPRGEIEFSVDGRVFGDRAKAPKPLNALVTLRNASLSVPTFPNRIAQINGVVRINPDAASVQQLTARYGEDAIAISSASVPLSEIDQHVRVNDVAGTVDFGSPSPQYPPAVARVLAALGPIGVYALTGSVDVDRSKPDAKTGYKIVVKPTERGALKLADVNTPVIFPSGAAVITPDLVDVSGLELPVFRGKVTGGVRVKLGGPRTTYEGEYEIAGVELELAKALWLEPDEKPQDIRGTLGGRGTFWGEIPEGDRPAADAFRAQGTIRVDKGYLYDVPVLRHVSDLLKIESGTVIGEAAVSFAIQDRVINVKRGVVSSPVVAMQGRGDIGFDGKLNLTVTAASQRGRQSGGGNGFVRDLLGAVNQGLAAAGQWGLYEFRVTGDNDNPRLQVVTPAINQTIDTIVGGVRDFAREAGRK